MPNGRRARFFASSAFSFSTETPAIAATRKEKGCLQYDLSRDPTVPESYLLYERWSDLESLKAHLASEHIATMQKALEGVRAAPPQARVLAPVGSH